MSKPYDLSMLKAAIRIQKTILSNESMSANDAYNIEKFGVDNKHASIIRRTMADKYGLFSGTITLCDVNEYIRYQEILSEQNY